MDVNDRYLRCGPVVNEKLHWMIAAKNRIVYFDPLTDEFGGFPMPEAPNNGQHNTAISGLGVLEGCARYVWEVGDEVELPCYVGNEDDSTLEVELDEVTLGFIKEFVMKQHGVVESWTQAFIISKDLGILPGPCYGWLVPLCFTNDGEGLVSVTDYPLLVYDHNGMLKRETPLLRNQHWIYMASYVESLASPAAYGHEEDWIVQGPNAWNFFCYSDTDSEDSSIKEDDISCDFDSDRVSFHSTKEDTSYGYCSDKESFHSTKEDCSIEEEDNTVF